MDGAGLVNFLKISTSTQNSDIPDTTYGLALAESHIKIVEKIKAKIDSKIFYNEYTADLVINKKQYDDLPITTASAVWIKYHTFQDDGVTPYKYIKARIKDITELGQSLSDLEENQSESSPIFMIADNSIYLYPIGSADVTDGIQIRGKMKIPRITESSPESAIFEGKLSEYHEVIVQGAKQLIYEIDKNITGARDAQVQFKIDLDDMITEISSRYDQPIDYEEPSLTRLAYNVGGDNPFTNNSTT